jgi:uncharacterized protein (DUF362 family)
MPPGLITILGGDTLKTKLNRRGFITQAAAVGGAAGLTTFCAAGSAAEQAQQHGPIGQPKGVHPGRVVWVHDPQVIDWKGPGDDHWYQANHTKQDRVNDMMSRAVCELAGQATVAKAWDTLFRHFNQARGKGDVPYKPGEKIAIKPNWVGMIYREGTVNPESYTLVRRQDYMNTAPQMIAALIEQLVGVGVKPSDITVCDTLAYMVHEYYGILHKAFPDVQYVDYAGKFGRIQVKASAAPLYWSCRPQGKTADVVPTCFAEAEYLVNFANLKTHTAAGVTLCGKNHFGSLVRWPVEQGFYDMHLGAFSQKTKAYRETVDLLGHAHLGGKTILNLLDALFSGKHPIDQAPRKWTLPPFGGNWTCSLLASQDPVAIDSVGCDFLSAEYEDCRRRPGLDDYLHEAALAHDPPSGTYYDPDHATPTKRLASLGVHEHWNSPQEKKYSRNLGTGKGIELVAIS